MDLKQEQAIYSESVLYLINIAMQEQPYLDRWGQVYLALLLFLLGSSGGCLRKNIKPR